ncbi:homoserine O-acetyltransferase MetX [Paenisporosarcina indica]|uniref:homoserine O-acetyltransferase MetX n=1 Tax=Paenisporosarcina indica TaxID=650093 RepID=UPI00095028E9|nr:homoserine O-acetyltransferase [Paenisporosarcina indica]
MATGSVSIGKLHLESDEWLEDAELSYESFGPEDEDAPVVLICHALTGTQYAIGSTESSGWWSGLIGPGKSIDTDLFKVITFNALGGCSGSTGPLSINPVTKAPYRSSFPEITIRDMVYAEKKALLALGIDNLHAVIGGSLGGMRVLEWGLLYPNDMNLLFPLAVTPYLSDTGIAFNYIGVHAIESDVNYKDGNYESTSDIKGFETARMAGLVTYRSEALHKERFARKTKFDGMFEVESYLKYQGIKLAERFDANSYLTLLKAMNTHDIGRGRDGIEAASKQYRAKLIAIAFTHDLIYPFDQIHSFSTHVPDSHFHIVNTPFGHDGFLTEFEKWGHILTTHLEEKKWLRLKQEN